MGETRSETILTVCWHSWRIATFWGYLDCLRLRSAWTRWQTLRGRGPQEITPDPAELAGAVGFLCEPPVRAPRPRAATEPCGVPAFTQELLADFERGLNESFARASADFERCLAGASAARRDRAMTEPS